MEVVKKGIAPIDRLYQYTCPCCSTVLRFTARDCVLVKRWCGPDLQLRCPTCGYRKSWPVYGFGFFSASDYEGARAPKEGSDEV